MTASLAKPAWVIRWPGPVGAGLVVILLLLAGCSSGPRLNPGEAATENATPRYENQPNRLNPSAYEVNGRSYRVLSNNTGYDEQGVASWYGPKFQSRPTASGERYNMYAMTAAHKTLRIPAYVQVTNLENGKQVVVRVNDRGPFVSNRIIDLSYAAARKIGMLGRGTAMVDVRVVTPDSPSAPVPVTVADRTVAPTPVTFVPSGRGSSAAALPHAVWGSDVFIQVGAYGEIGHVLDVRRRLDQANLGPVRTEPVGSLSRVRIGPIPSLETYDQMMDQLRKIGFENAQMVVEQ